MVRIKTLADEAVLYVGAMLPIICIIGGDISTAQEHRIYYKKPLSGTVGYWSASKYDLLAGEISYVTAQTDLDESGTWTFWGWEKDAADNENPGRAIQRMVYEVGNVPV